MRRGEKRSWTPTWYRITSTNEREEGGTHHFYTIAKLKWLCGER